RCLRPPASQADPPHLSRFDFGAPLLLRLRAPLESNPVIPAPAAGGALNIGASPFGAGNKAWSTETRGLRGSPSMDGSAAGDRNGAWAPESVPTATPDSQPPQCAPPQSQWRSAKPQHFDPLFRADRAPGTPEKFV